MIHGGDIYRNQIELDFSVNVNPLGMPKSVELALMQAVKESACYPDILAEELKKSVAFCLGVPEESLLFGNGASELFLAVVHAVSPKKTVIPVPSFYGYEYAARAAGGNICYVPLREQNGFCVDEELLNFLDETVDLLFLANPNNPVGNTIEPELLYRILCHCRARHILVVLDECFAEFCGEEVSALPWREEFPNLLIVRAFTKIYAIPGVRLGYLIGTEKRLLKRIGEQLPEWNLSTFAQRAGCAACQELSYVAETKREVAKERRFLKEGLEALGITVYEGAANFLFLKSELFLYEELRKRHILIRDCSNYRGLKAGYYRVAVKQRKENEKLLGQIGEICGKRLSV